MVIAATWNFNNVDKLQYKSWYELFKNQETKVRLDSRVGALGTIGHTLKIKISRR